MSRWTPITQADLEDAKLAKLVTALRTKALAVGQTDPTARITQSVLDDIQRKIASHPQNRTDADETLIPRGLKPMACDLILARLKGRLEIPLTEDERRTCERHERNLDRIAGGLDTVEQPDDAVAPAVESRAGKPSVKAPARRLQRSGL